MGNRLKTSVIRYISAIKPVISKAIQRALLQTVETWSLMESDEHLLLTAKSIFRNGLCSQELLKVVNNCALQ